MSETASSAIGISPDLLVVGDRVPGHRNEIGLKIVLDFQRLQQTGICPFSKPIMRPKHDVGPFTGLGGGLKFIGQTIRCFHFYRDAEILLKFLTDFGQAAVALVAADPDQEFTIGPGETPGMSNRTELTRKRVL